MMTNLVHVRARIRGELFDDFVFSQHSCVGLGFCGFVEGGEELAEDYPCQRNATDDC